MGKKYLDNLKHGRNISKTLEEMNANTPTKIAAVEFENEPNNKKLNVLIQNIENDENISLLKKNELFISLRNNYIKLFNFHNCPNDYESLKQEVKFLSGVTQYSFLIMAQRLIKIRDEELYRFDNYSDFKSFIEHELSISRQTVYNFIFLIECFGVKALLHESIDKGDNEIKYSKLFPIVPLIKDKENLIPESEKEEIKSYILNNLDTLSFRDVQREAIKYKIKYGYLNDNKKNVSLTKIIRSFLKLIPDELNETGKEEIRRLIEKLEIIIK